MVAQYLETRLVILRLGYLEIRLVILKLAWLETLNLLETRLVGNIKLATLDLTSQGVDCPY